MFPHSDVNAFMKDESHKKDVSIAYENQLTAFLQDLSLLPWRYQREDEEELQNHCPKCRVRREPDEKYFDADELCQRHLEKQRELIWVRFYKHKYDGTKRI